MSFQHDVRQHFPSTLIAESLNVFLFIHYLFAAGYKFTHLLISLRPNGYLLHCNSMIIGLIIGCIIAVATASGKFWIVSWASFQKRFHLWIIFLCSIRLSLMNTSWWINLTIISAEWLLFQMSFPLYLSIIDDMHKIFTN